MGKGKKKTNIVSSSGVFWSYILILGGLHYNLREMGVAGMWLFIITYTVGIISESIKHLDKYVLTVGVKER